MVLKKNSEDDKVWMGKTIGNKNLKLNFVEAKKSAKNSKKCGSKELNPSFADRNLKQKKVKFKNKNALQFSVRHFLI